MNNTHKIISPVKLILLVSGLCALFLLIGCDILLPAQPLPPTATATQTLTPTATIDWFPATPTPTFIVVDTPTPQPNLSLEKEGITELLIEDDFTDESLWALAQSGSGNVAFGNQNLTLAVSRQNASLSSNSQHVIPENFYLELTIQNTLCQPTDQVGIEFWRQSASDFYRLLLTCSGQYRLELVQGGQSIVVHDWDTATQMQIAPPATNRIGLWAHKGEFRFYINDTFQFEERIAQNRSGELAVFARTISGTALTVRFSNLNIFTVSLD